MIKIIKTSILCENWVLAAKTQTFYLIFALLLKRFLRPFSNPPPPPFLEKYETTIITVTETRRTRSASDGKRRTRRIMHAVNRLIYVSLAFRGRDGGRRT